jgi:integrase
MRIKAIFTVFGRKLLSGKMVYYYQCYDENGKRQWAKSTGLNKKTEAVAYCMKLYRDGLLIPEQKVPTFAEFSNGWWVLETCRYLKWRQLHEPITKSTITIHKSNFDIHIKDYFAKYRRDEITPDVIEGWLLHLSEKGLKPNTVNLQYRTFKLMMGEAFRLKLIKNNPCREVKDVKAEETRREILTVEEVKKLFPKNWSEIWESSVVYKAHRLAACTGLRIGELRGLRGEYVFDDYIYITGQYGSFGYVPNTKTKHNRNIPLSPVMRQELEELLQLNGDGYVFSDDGGATPISHERIRRQFDRALELIGISHEEKLRRNLSFHAWRHFLNTLLLMSDVSVKKVQSVTGHLTGKMTDHYTHFDTRQFNEVRNVQAELLALPDNTKKPEGKAKGKAKAAAVKEPTKKATAKKKAIA